MAEDLLDTVGQLFGTVRGGLAYAVIFVGALLAATTGVVAASVIAMGLISLPIMLRYGYDRRLASGVIAASGTLAQIIPPSLVLIVMADQLGRSVGDMYAGAFIPGLVLAAMYAAYVFGVAMLFPNAAPGLPPEAQSLKDADGKVRRLSLLVVAIVAGIIAYYTMQRTEVKAGADFVVLMLSIGIAVAFVIAVGEPAAAAQSAVAHRRTDDLRAGAATRADLSRARDDLHRRRDADRRRRDGRDRRSDPRGHQGPSEI